MKTARWQRCRASGEAWLGGEGEGVAAELLDMLERRGGDGGRDYGGETATGGSAMVRESEGEREGATTAVRRRQVDRPWCGRARERGRGRVRCPRGRGGDMEPIQRPGA